MLALLDEAIQVGTQIGDRLSVATSIVNKGWVVAYRGDNRLALHAASEAAERFLHAGDLATVGVVLRLGAVALTHLGRPEPAAVLFGMARRLVYGALLVWAVQLISDAETALIAQLGEAALNTLRAQGAAVTTVDALAYLINAAQTTTAKS
jgi:hypothetical protein